MSIRVIGEAEDYDQLRAILIGRRRALKLSQLALDNKAGLQEGYTGKLEIGKDRGGRNMGPVSTALWLGALGVRIVVVIDEKDQAA